MVTAMQNPRTPHDSSYKAMFGFPAMVESLLQDFLPEDFVKYFNFSTLKPSKASYVCPNLGELHNDLVWHVNWRDKPSILAIILEFQSSDDYWMSVRLAAYTAMFWLDYRKGKLKAGSLLPSVFPIVLYNGEDPWKAPTEVQEIIDMPYPPLLATQLNQKYYVIDAKRVPGAMLIAAKGAAAYVIRGEQANTGDQLVEISVDALSNAGEGVPTELVDILNAWLAVRLKMVDPDGPLSQGEEQSDMQFAEMLKNTAAHILERKNEILAEGEAKGRAEGEAKGRAEGEGMAVSDQREGLLEMLAVRFGEIPITWRTAVSRLNDTKKINGLAVALLKVKSSDEYGDLLMAAAQS